MTPGKFDWFLHTMLFLQTQHVLKNGKNKALAAIDEEDEEDDEEDDGDDV